MQTLQRYLAHLEQDPNNFHLHLEVSQSHRELKNWQAAQLHLDKAKQLAKMDFYFLQGKLYLKMHQLKEAETAFRLALTERDTESNRFHLAFCLLQNGNSSEALKVIGDLDGYAASILKARILYMEHGHEAALNLLEVLKEHPEADAEVFGFMSCLYLDLDDAARADFYSQKARKLNPQNRDACMVELILHAVKGEVTANELETALLNRPEDPRLIFLLGCAQFKDMNIEAAEQSFLRASKIWPDFFDNRLNLGWCYLLKNDFDSANREFHACVKIDSTQADGWGSKALALSLKKDAEGAEIAVKNALELNKECFSALMAEIFLTEENPAQAGEKWALRMPGFMDNLMRLVSGCGYID